MVGGSKEDLDKFDYFENNKYKYKRVEVKFYSLLKNGSEEKVSASNIRNDPKYRKSMKWIPKVLTKEEKQEVLKILKD